VYKSFAKLLLLRISLNPKDGVENSRCKGVDRISEISEST